MTSPALARLLAVGVAALALEALCRTGAVSPLVIIPPSQMVASLFDLLGSRVILDSLVFTLGVVALASLLSVALGTAAGILLHALAPVRRVVEPFLAAYYAVPNFVFYPLFIVIFGLGVPALLALAVVFAMGAMIIATLEGLDDIPPIYRRVARVHRLSFAKELWNIRFPAALPSLLAGLKLVVAYAFIAVIAGEFILSDRGIGHEIAFAYNAFNNRAMYGLILLVVLLVLAINSLLRVVERAGTTPRRASP